MAASLAVLLAGARVRAQNPRRAAAGSDARGPRRPIDLTGYWVSVVNEDWRFRMVTPAKGDYKGVPITREALQIVNAWNPAADEAAGNQCKSYGAAAIMRVPGRIHITWQDDNTLKLETDAGMQTRLFQFGAPAAPPAQRNVAGPVACALGAARPGQSGGQSGIARGDDHEHEGGLPAEERRTLQ